MCFCWAFGTLSRSFVRSQPDPWINFAPLFFPGARLCREFFQICTLNKMRTIHRWAATWSICPVLESMKPEMITIKFPLFGWRLEDFFALKTDRNLLEKVIREMKRAPRYRSNEPLLMGEPAQTKITVTKSEIVSIKYCLEIGSARYLTRDTDAPRCVFMTH